MLAHIVTKYNRSIYADYLDKMFRQRKTVFIDRLGWSALSAPDGRERDEIDDVADVEYILTIDEFGELVGSARFTPTTGPHLLGGPLSDYVERPYSPAAGTWELTRYIPTTDNDAPNKMSGRAYILTAIVEWALRRNAARVLGITDDSTLAFTARLGWRNGLLGMPRDYENGGRGAAVWFEHDRDALLNTRTFWELDRPVTFEAPQIGSTAASISKKEIAYLDEWHDVGPAAGCTFRHIPILVPPIIAAAETPDTPEGRNIVPEHQPPQMPSRHAG